METYQPKTIQKDLNRGIRCKNTSGEEMPGFSAFMVGSEVSGVVQAIKPDEDSAKQVLLSPPNAVPNNGIFFARSPYDEFATYSDSSLDAGDQLGTVSGSWELSTAQTGFVVVSDSGGVARVRPFSGGGLTVPTSSIPEFTEVLSGSGAYTGSWLSFSDQINPVLLTGKTQFRMVVLGAYGSSEGVDAFAFSDGFASMTIEADIKYTDDSIVQSFSPSTERNPAHVYLKTANNQCVIATAFFADFELEDKSIKEFRVRGSVNITGAYNPVIEFIGGSDSTVTFAFVPYL